MTGRRSSAARLLVGGVAALALAGCAASAGAGESAVSAVATDRPSPRARSTTAGPVTPARVARTAASERVRFRPERVSLPDGASAPVDPAATVGGVLAVPADIRRVGWWDGSAWVGDPFGSTVVAGHLDAPGQGLGFFEQLTGLRRGDVVTLTGSGHRAAYRVTEVAAMRKSSIDATSPVFDQRGEHRLVLMTCAGHFDRSTHSYDENLVVTAVPDGAAH